MKILLILLMTFSAMAGEITPIKKGDPSPYDGFVITKSFEKNLRFKNEKYKLLETKTLTLSDLQVVNTQRINFYQKTSKDAYSELRREKVKGFFGKVLYFTGGIVLGGLVSYAAMSIYK